ncbi:hypothetical protein U1Q18_033648, partial [Sarracenia purpurea var. burkii]
MRISHGSLPKCSDSVDNSRNKWAEGMDSISHMDESILLPIGPSHVPKAQTMNPSYKEALQGDTH